MFNNENFKAKLEFAIRQWDVFGVQVYKTFNESKTDLIMNLLWDASLKTMWQTRISDTVFMGGIDKKEEFEYFTRYLTIVLNQFNQNIIDINKNYSDNYPSKLVEYNKLVKQMVNSAAEELEEYFKTTAKK